VWAGAEVKSGCVALVPTLRCAVDITCRGDVSDPPRVPGVTPQVRLPGMLGDSGDGMGLQSAITHKRRRLPG
jgi:hypothetical protein